MEHFRDINESLLYNHYNQPKGLDQNYFGFDIIFIRNILLIQLNKNNLMNQKTEDLYGVHPSNDPESYKDQAAFAAHMAHYQNPALYQAFMNTYHRFSLK